MRPQSYGSSTTGVKKSAVTTTARSALIRTTAPSSPFSSPTSRSPVPVAAPEFTGPAGRPASTDSSSPAGILHAHPPPEAYWVSRRVVVVVTGLRYPRPAAAAHATAAQRAGPAVAGDEADRGAPLVNLPGCGDPGRGAPGPPTTVSGGGVSRLVTGAVLKTVVAEYLGQAGSIPVRLRQPYLSVRPTRGNLPAQRRFRPPICSRHRPRSGLCPISAP